MRILVCVYLSAIFVISALLIDGTNAGPAGPPGQQARLKQAKLLLGKEKAFCKAFLATATSSSITTSTSSSLFAPVRIIKPTTSVTSTTEQPVQTTSLPPSSSSVIVSSTDITTFSSSSVIVSSSDATTTSSSSVIASSSDATISSSATSSEVESTTSATTAPITSDPTPLSTETTTSSMETVTETYTEYEETTTTTTSTTTSTYTPTSLGTTTAATPTQTKTITSTSTTTTTYYSPSVSLTSTSTTTVYAETSPTPPSNAKRGIPTAQLQLLANVVSSKNRLKSPKYVIPYDETAVKEACLYLLYGTQVADIPTKVQAKRLFIAPVDPLTIYLTTTETSTATVSALVTATVTAPTSYEYFTVFPTPVTTFTTTTTTVTRTSFSSTTQYAATATASVATFGPGYLVVASGPKQGKYISYTSYSDPGHMFYYSEYGFTDTPDTVFTLDPFTSKFYQKGLAVPIKRKDSSNTDPVSIESTTADYRVVINCQSDLSGFVCSPIDNALINKWFFVASSTLMIGINIPDHIGLGGAPSTTSTDEITLLFVSKAVE